MNVYIRPGAALDDATQIDSIIGNINDALIELDNTITSLIPEELSLDWAREILDNWNRYYNNDVQNALREMEASGRNLRLAVEGALQYSSGK